MARSQAATRQRDRIALRDLATEFDGYIRQHLDDRRRAGDRAPDDTTTRLLRERTDEGPLDEEAIVSIVRNWTAGEIGSIATSVGIVVASLADAPELQAGLRAEPARLPGAIDEILRIDGPLPSNRRVTTSPVEIGGRTIAAGERVTVFWPAANRDEAVFGDPDRFDPDANAPDNLVFGAGIHVCPGAPLARAQLRVFAEELLERTEQLEPGAEPRHRAHLPAGGFERLPLRFAPATAR